MILKNGRGQLGSELEKQLNNYNNANYFNNTIIYHTWNVWEKTEEKQKIEYNKLIKCVDNNKDKRIVYISTMIDNDTPYVKYKRLGEEYVANNTNRNIIIRIPNLIGKGVCTKFRDENISAFGNIDLETIANTTSKILNIIKHDKKNNKMIYEIKGNKIPAYMVKELILFGDNK